jgi:nucleoside-diphosphate-sugar epimerase
LETMLVNSMGLLEAIRFADSHSARVVFASTSEIYGDPEVHPQPESYRGSVNTVGPRSCYDEAKRFGEALLYTMNLRNGTRHGIIRIFNTYGPRMKPLDGRVVINFLMQGLAGEDLTVYGNGAQTRSFCYVDDLVNGILAFAKSNELGPMNIGNDREFTVLQLAEAVQKLFPEKSLKLRQTDLPVDDPQQRRPDLSLAKSKLKWQPVVHLDAGLAKMLASLKDSSV